MDAIGVPAQRCATGVPGLDEVLHGGLLCGGIYLVDGHPGAGKTTLALQFLLQGIAEGERGVYVTLSETAEELRAGARSHGLSLEGIEIVELIASEGLLDGETQLTMYHPAEIELSETTRRVTDVIERVQPQRLVFDSLSEFRLVAQNSLRYRRQILALKQFLVGRGCTTLLLDDRTAEASDLQLQSIVHGVIALDHTVPRYGPALRQLRVVKFRGSDYLSGMQDMLIGHGGLTVFPRLTASDHGSSFERDTVASGVRALDQLLGGGIERGTATLMVGPPGSGKSTIAIQFAAAAVARGDHSAIFTFEEGRSLLLDRARGMGMPIETGVGPGRMRVEQIDPAQVLPSQFANLVRAAVEDDGARVVVIDSLNGYLNAMPEERALTIQLHELIQYLNNHGVATFLVAAHAGMVGAPQRHSVDASYLADAVILLRMFEHAGMVKKAISVVKKRSGAHEEAIRELWFDSEGVHLSEPLLHLRGVLGGIPVEIGAGAVETMVAAAARPANVA
jgi:circadian clock protein KaiC